MIEEHPFDAFSQAMNKATNEMSELFKVMGLDPSAWAVKEVYSLDELIEALKDV